MITSEENEATRIALQAGLITAVEAATLGGKARTQGCSRQKGRLL